MMLKTALNTIHNQSSSHQAIFFPSIDDHFSRNHSSLNVENNLVFYLGERNIVLSGKRVLVEINSGIISVLPRQPVHLSILP